MLDFAVRLVAVVNPDPQLTEIKRERMVSRVVGGSGQEAHNPRKRARTLDFRGCGLVGLLTGGGGGAVECGKSPRTSARARLGGCRWGLVGLLTGGGGGTVEKAQERARGLVLGGVVDVWWKPTIAEIEHKCSTSRVVGLLGC